MSSVVTDEIRASASELYHGDKICREKTKVLLTEVGLPNGLLPLENIEECGYVKDTGFVWLKQKKKKEHKFEKVGRLASYANEVTAYVEKSKIKKLTGVKTKELMMWINLSEISVDDPPTGKITFKSPTGLFRTFPVSAFQVEDEDEQKLQVKEDARNVFDEMPSRNTVSFVTLIQGYSELFPHVESTKLFVRLHREGHELNAFVFTTLLKLLVNMECAELARNFHGTIYKLGHHSNAFVGTALLDAYSSCGFVANAREVFDGISNKDMVSWTGMITCYAENDYFKEAFELFSRMRMLGFNPNNFTLASIFKACLGLEAIEVGKSVHGCAIKTCYEIDPYVSVSLLDMYTKSGDIEDARLAFEEIPKKDVIPWSFMIARYSQSDRSEEAVRLFCRMRQGPAVPNQFTFASMLQACATMENLRLGKQIHCHVQKVGLDLNVYVSNALMDVYAKCGFIEESVSLFRESKNRNEVSWNTLIVGYVLLGNWNMALTLFFDMLKDHIQLTEVTYSSILRACASLTVLEPGIQIHCLTIKTLYEDDVVVANALVDMCYIGKLFGQSRGIYRRQMVAPVRRVESVMVEVRGRAI
ncbi:hypothetical protein L6452_07949 [Arctium lappa]|uniref:Uncharacterized protein n=1 Tax=Arctium lappa TaxID=4217 RepID=A0ACB9DFX8_ARCLA|nr:hypothetical protein L6452_07949 [Arctium lappa]